MLFSRAFEAGFSVSALTGIVDGFGCSTLGCDRPLTAVLAIDCGFDQSGIALVTRGCGSSFVCCWAPFNDADSTNGSIDKVAFTVRSLFVACCFFVDTRCSVSAYDAHACSLARSVIDLLFTSQDLLSPLY